jgi:hemerythrin-like domain-containing protein
LLDYLNYFWEGHLKGHFFNEETLLFNKINADVCIQAKLDHRNIVSQIEQLNSTKQDDRNAYQVLIDRLNDHIRYEERIVFPYLEDSLSASLPELMTALGGECDKEFKDEYKDEFWVKGK